MTIRTETSPWRSENVELLGGPLQVFRLTGNPPNLGTIVFFHGWGEPPLSYQELLTSLSAKGWDIIAPAFPGYAESRLFRRPFIAPVTRGSRRVAKAISALRHNRPWLVAHSMGAATAVHLAEKHPDTIAGLVLICPIGQPSTKIKDWARAATDLRSGKNRWNKLAPVLRHNPLYLAVAGIDSKRHNLIDRYRQLTSNHVPIILVSSNNDRVVRSDRLTLIPGVGNIGVFGDHGFPINNPIHCANVVHEAIVHTQAKFP